MGLIQEFKKFAMRGNVIDMAVVIIIGAVFCGIVISLVKDVVMPPLGYVLNGVDFSDLKVVLKPGVPADPATGAAAVDPVSINYGVFINTVINFLVVALVIFFVIKAMNRATAMLERKKEEEPPAPTEKECPRCFTKISIKATRCPNCTSDIG